MRILWSRALPALLVLGLLALGLAASSHRVRARGGSQTQAYYYPRCDLLLQSGGASSTVGFSQYEGITQPFGPGVNVAACSLSMAYPFNTYGRLDVAFWDPALVAPDPTTLALRSRSFAPSDLVTNHVREDFYPPIVSRSVPHVADGRSGMLELNYENVYGPSAQLAYFDPDGNASAPVAYRYPSGGPRVPLTGGHPVLAHAICGGDAALQNLYVTQSVMTTNAVLAPAYEAVQLFRVPYPVTLRWVELAFGVTSAQTLSPGMIAILDAQGLASPPSTLPGAMGSATFLGNVPIAQWGSHFDFDNGITLQPSHDYYLQVRTDHDYPLYARSFSGPQSADFTAGVGGLYIRPNPSGPWSQQTNQALAFRLIGEALLPVDVPQPMAPEPGAFRLRIAPNPSRGVAFVTWTGAQGPVRFEVLDARGRRVAEGGGASGGAEGRWLWNAAQSDGRPLPAGVYFVRARDAAHAATERVVLVR